MDFETRNAMSTNDFLSIYLFFIKMWVILMETPIVIWVNYSTIFPSLYGSLVSANRSVYVLPLICLWRFLVIECLCYFAKFILTYLSFKSVYVWPSLGDFWWFTRSLVDLEEWSSFSFKFLIILHLQLSGNIQMLLHATTCITF